MMTPVPEALRFRRLVPLGLTQFLCVVPSALAHGQEEGFHCDDVTRADCKGAYEECVALTESEGTDEAIDKCLGQGYKDCCTIPLWGWIMLILIGLFLLGGCGALCVYIIKGRLRKTKESSFAQPLQSGRKPKANNSGDPEDPDSDPDEDEDEAPADSPDDANPPTPNTPTNDAAALEATPPPHPLETPHPQPS